MASHNLGQISDWADGEATATVIGGEKVVVWRSGEEVCVVRNHCPHLGLSLTRGPGGVHASDGEITCPWHNSRFDICSGENTDWVAGVAGRSIPRWSQRMLAMGREPSPLTTYPVSRDGNSLVVEI